MRIGILADAYPHRRNINHKTDNAYRKINYLNLNAYLRVVVRLLGSRFEDRISRHFVTDDYRGSIFDGFFYDIGHFFNLVSFSGRPWCSSFETTVPFFRQEIETYLHSGLKIDQVKNRNKLRLGIQACAADSCKALIAISKCTLQLELDLISNFPEYESRIKQKLVQLYPPQELLISSFSEKGISIDGKLRFLFVGREFYRKGGLAILRCFEELALDHDFEVIIVSGLSNDVPSVFSSEDEMLAHEIIKRADGTWLTYHRELDNAKVIALMKQSHVGLLPTYSDTFGFSVLEFQACGCPVISTDVRALPEINDNGTGWIIPTGEKNAYQEIANVRHAIDARLIETSMKNIVADIFANRDQILLKAHRSIARIAEFHAPTDYQHALTNLYLSSR